MIEVQDEEAEKGFPCGRQHTPGLPKVVESFIWQEMSENRGGIDTIKTLVLEREDKLRSLDSSRRVVMPVVDIYVEVLEIRCQRSDTLLRFFDLSWIDIESAIQSWRAKILQ